MSTLFWLLLGGLTVTTVGILWATRRRVKQVVDAVPETPWQPPYLIGPSTYREPEQMYAAPSYDLDDLLKGYSSDNRHDETGLADVLGDLFDSSTTSSSNDDFSGSGGNFGGGGASGDW